MRFAILSMGLLVFVSSARADEKTVKVGDLPKAVAAALKAKYPKGEVTKASKDEEDGKTVYEAVVEVEGKKFDVALTPKGKILEIEQAIDADDLPKAVAATIAAKYPKAKIKKAELVIKFEEDEEEKSFEVTLSTKGQDDVEVKLSPKGKILEDEDEDDEDDDKPSKKEKKEKDDEDDKPVKKKG